MRSHLIFDADDTLWENNIYFESAFDEFVAFLDHSTMTGDEVRGVLDEIELVNNRIHGYGSLNFGRNLRECYRRLAQRAIEPADLEQVMGIATRIMQHPIELLPDVKETLEYLAVRHDLLLFTMGHPEEQKLKIDQSGLAIYFGHTAIVKEKDSASYRRLVSGNRLDPARTWMIGNSPKSDINPALEAGIGAVYVPHERTWHLERTELRNGGRLVMVERFSDLRRHF